MASTQGNAAAAPSSLSLVVLSGDTALGGQLRELAAKHPGQTTEIVTAPDPESARAALASRGRSGIVLYDLRGHNEASGNLLSALPVLGRLGGVVALVDDETSSLAHAALNAGAADAVAMPDLTPALLVHVLRHAIARRIGDQQLVKLRPHEPIIGIPSQLLFWEILTLAVRRAKRNRDFFAVLLLDIDNLPDGDSVDGPYRDFALRDLVTHIRPILRGSDTIARLESQQLAILVESMPRVEDIQIVAEKIIEVVEQPLDSGTGPMALDAAIGIALFPTSADNAEAMLTRATDAMLQARERGRNRFAFA